MSAAALLSCGEPRQATPGSSGTNEAPEVVGHVERLSPALDALVPPDAVIEVLADGFEWSEGPVWIGDGGYLLFSDIPNNAVFRWEEGEGHHLWLQPAGHTGPDTGGGEPGSNGLLLDPQGRLVLCQHGDRRMARLDAPLTSPIPSFVTLADRWNGRRFNSPNDAVYHSSGALYFTDPPYGLAGGVDDPSREIDFQGVYRLSPEGDVTLLDDGLSRPNGIAFSPDERTLYVANSDPERVIWKAYDVAGDGTVSNGRVFFDATDQYGDLGGGNADGLKVDVGGNLFATGPGGVLVLSPEGQHLGTIHTTELTANCAFGDDGSSLYITADRYLLRIRLSTTGVGFSQG